MKRFFLSLIVILLWGCILAQRLVNVGEGYSSTSVNTTVFRNNSLVTDRNTQYISYYDAEGFLIIGKRELGTDKWMLQRSQYKGNVADAHNVISMMVDGDGYLHLSFNHHGNKLNYCKSTVPSGLTLGEKEHMIGFDEEDVTYPEFYKMPDGDLLFAYRSGVSGRGNLVLNRYDLKNKKWIRVQDILIDGENQRNAYWQLCIDNSGVIHVSWVWRETWQVETNYDLCYAYSPDEGKTWYKSTGEQYVLPICKDNAEYACRIPQDSELINQTSMCTDTEGNPYIVTYWRDKNSEVPQYRLVWSDGNGWKTRQIMNRSQGFSLKGGGTKMVPISRPRIAVDKGKAYFVFRDAERGSKVSMAFTDDVKSGEWQVKDLTDFSVDAWEPSYDTELWRVQRKLHVFVQETHQGDGEKVSMSDATPVYVLEIN